MAEGEDSQPERRFYDVNRFWELLMRQRLQPRPRLVLRVVRRAGRSLDSIQGLFIAIGGMPVVFGGTFLAVIVGALYGPLAFLAVFGGSLAALSFYVDRKVGKSLQFGDYSVLRRGLAQLVGFALVLGAIYLLILVTGLLNHLKGLA